ncbi:MAG: hypothetical protein ACRDU8_00415, partial [Egibacteraceae bacterium]
AGWPPRAWWSSRAAFGADGAAVARLGDARPDPGVDSRLRSAWQSRAWVGEMEALRQAVEETAANPAV